MKKLTEPKLGKGLFQKLISHTKGLNHANLSSARTTVLRRYRWYQSNKRALEKVGKTHLSADEGDAMKGLYEHGEMDTVKAAIRTQAPLICQYCGIDSVGSLDHYLPKSLLPEYSVFPLNLVPCCKTCNNDRRNEWIDTGRRVHVHFYVDEVSRKPLLDAKVKLSPNPEVVYRLQSKPTDRGFPGLFARHVTQLGLLTRYEIRAGWELGNLRHSLKLSPEPDLKKYLDAQASTSRTREGGNHWRTVLYSTLAGSTALMAKIQ